MERSWGSKEECTTGQCSCWTLHNASAQEPTLRALRLFWASDYVDWHRNRVSQFGRVLLPTSTPYCHRAVHGDICMSYKLTDNKKGPLVYLNSAKSVQSHCSLTRCEMVVLKVVSNRCQVKQTGTDYSQSSSQYWRKEKCTFAFIWLHSFGKSYKKCPPTQVVLKWPLTAKNANRMLALMWCSLFASFSFVFRLRANGEADE